MPNNFRRQSLIINNFFTLASIIIIAVTLTLYNRYFNQNDEVSTSSEKKSYLKLECQNDNDRFKVINRPLMENSLKALNNGFYKISGGFLKKEKDSIINQIVDDKKIESFYKLAINTPAKDDISKFLQIDYEIIEGRNTQSKVFKSGSVKTVFKANGSEIFRYYSDFKFYDENEIKNIIDCTIKVYRNYASK